MIKRLCVEAVDRTLKDIMSCNRIFGGKCVVMGGDFRQILPIIPKAGRAEIVDASLNTSYLWIACKLRHLTRNMRLQSAIDPMEQQLIQSFSKWLLKVGDGELGQPHDGIADIEIPSDLLIKECHDQMKAIVDATYPNVVHKFLEHNHLTSRAILAPTTEMVDKLNEYICSLIPGEYIEYNSSNSVNRTEQCNDSFADLYDIEFLNKVNCSGVPGHVLKLKVGVPVTKKCRSSSRFMQWNKTANLKYWKKCHKSNCFKWKQCWRRSLDPSNGHESIGK